MNKQAFRALRDSVRGVVESQRAAAALAQVKVKVDGEAALVPVSAYAASQIRKGQVEILVRETAREEGCEILMTRVEVTGSNVTWLHTARCAGNGAGVVNFASANNADHEGANRWDALMAGFRDKTRVVEFKGEFWAVRRFRPNS